VIRHLCSWRLIVVLAGAALAVCLLAFVPVGRHLESARAWIESLGGWGLVFLAAVYVPACVLLVPGTPLSLLAGYLYGVVPATIAISIGSTLGASAAFWVGRTLARGWVEAKLADQPRFRALDQAVGAQGFKIVLLTRLSPAIPFNVLNYAFGLTKVRFRDYFLASWIGMLPGTILYVYLGSVAERLTDLVSGQRSQSFEEKILFYGGLGVTIVLTVYLARMAKKALAHSAAASDDGRGRDTNVAV
jgi:uncharacterized membrane protein YdjX (TVP38/TMEM64 family)